MEYGSGSKHDRPAQAGRRSKNILDGMEDWQKLRARVLSGKMTTSEAVWMIMTPEDAKRTGRKNIHRIARDRMKALLEELNLESDFSVELYKTNDPVDGSWCLSIGYEPPLAKVGKKARAAAA